ncbi:hypothetical protein WR25_15480 [Diploscapter pachys]|uniref:Uncharacterized protein n=1 Tax=Diploscapter pachys TaxID=2018661 RepID=A0A2A2J3J4_9BILA|nr:hypothetical protein WR25_15480 [Diploscapter pachys]
MGHKPFERKQSSSSSTSNLVSISQTRRIEEMSQKNGTINLTDNEEEDSMLNRAESAFRDEVSKRMGEMLLKGYTMLDAYCDTCAGILMEDKNGVRRCVQCEVYKEYQDKRKLTNNDLVEDDGAYRQAFTGSTSTSIATPSSSIPQRPQSNFDVANVVHTYGAHQTQPTLTSCKKAISAVQKKLDWATANLEASTDLEEISKYLQIIEHTMRILHKYK